MEQILVFILIVVAIALLALVLIQHGKGADIGASFGSGASNTVFGSQGSTSFLMKLTGVLAIIFFAICIILTRMASIDAKNAHGLNIKTPTQQSQPAMPASTPVKSNSTVPSVPK
tara:strand:- start:49299 stop:49643 length:345 start_codon:yes stop_codon:yes gene_type:complete